MASRGKRKGSGRNYFVLEDGEVSDIEEEHDAEKHKKKKRDDDFIRQWTERKTEENNATVSNSADMDVSSDEETVSKINTKPIAMTITFYDDKFAQLHRAAFETDMISKFGSSYVDLNESCIFVLQEENSKENDNSIADPCGLMSIVFHDDVFCSRHRNYMYIMCKRIFGSSKLTCKDNWCIEIVLNDILDFQVDTKPFGREQQTHYDIKPSGVIAAENNGNNKKKGPTCFNCLGDHQLKNCRKPRRHDVIKENRAKFLNSSAKFLSRYHETKEKFSQYLPGQISDELREALGLESDELPLHIYMMRKYGYPPGWMLEAVVENSGVSVYGKEGIVYQNGDEDGEIIDSPKDLYDIKKLIAFPGFNAPIPEGMKDEHEKFDCPSISEVESLEKMADFLKPNAIQAYQKKMNDSNGTILLDDSSSESSGESESEECKSPQPSVSTTQAVTPKSSTVDLGTPILASYSPYAKVPDREKFAAAMGDVINFENLPESTGTYEKMIGSIAKIRKFKKQN